MAEITWNERAWSDQARVLAARTASNGDGIGDRTRLVRLLAHIEAGWRLRSSLDPQVLDHGGERVRRSIVRGLTELRQAVDELLAAAEPGSSVERTIAAKVKEWTILERSALQTLMNAADRGPLNQALAEEAMRGDLEWFSLLVDRLEREPGPGRTAWLEVELSRTRNLLGAGNGRPLPKDSRRAVLRSRCERMRGILLERRVQKELDATIEDAGPHRLAAVRLKLSRLQARVSTLDIVDEGEGEHSWPGGHPETWARALAERREQVAERVEQKLLALDPADAPGRCDQIVQGSRDELIEMIAFLEDAPARRAVLRLELAREDLDRLLLTFRTLKADMDRKLRADRARHEPADANEPDAQEGAIDDPRKQIDQRIVEVRRLRRTVRGEWQEKLLSLRLQNLLGRRGAAILDNVVLVLILALAGLILGETFLERSGRLDLSDQRLFAWIDLAICSALLAELTLRLSLAPSRGVYFVRHFVIDFLASLPFGFFAYLLDEHLSPRGGETLWLLRYLRFARLLEILLYLRVAMPVIRLARIGLFALRVSDRLVRKNAGLLNRNIVLFEPHHALRSESSDRHRLATLRSELQAAESVLAPKLDQSQQDVLAARALSDLSIRLEFLPDQSIEPLTEHQDGREVPVEALVERLIQLTPEELLDRMGQGFVATADSYIRLLDAPIVRRLPLIRNLVAYREKSPAEAVTLAANYVGHTIQRGLDLIYFLADLQATLSPAIFLDRLGSTLVNATRTPAKRLLWLGSAFLVLFLVVNAVGFLRAFRPFIDAVQKRLGWPVIVLGVVCLVFWMLGSWFRKIANQSADFCERIVEAQFAAQTKTFKARRSDQDAKFLAERVIDPELLLRSSDNLSPDLYHRDSVAVDVETTYIGPQTTFENRELTFLRNIRLLYQDYLDGSPFHRNDTKTSVQLLGNLALSNLRRSNLEHLLRQGRALGKLDLNRSGGLLGGPHLWFNYITRIIIQDTALLLLDYNRHAVPLDRLACSHPDDRRAFQNWLAGRLRIEPDDVRLPALHAASMVGTREREPAEAHHKASQRREADGFLETVEFTAIDFLAEDSVRDAVIQARFGPQVALLVTRDRQQNVRRAFRSFPLQDLPLAQRTVNPYAFYENHLSRGRIVFFPIVVAVALIKSAIMAVRGVYQGVHQILNPQVARDREIPADSYTAALRKIHRMRKPVFMGSLWLRARFDVEYLGLPLPTAPDGISFDSLMETDLDFIGASRKDRIIAEKIRRDHQRRLEWTGRWLNRFDWSFDALSPYLARKIPHLANRGGEALRALVAACVLDHDDVATLASSIEALTMLMQFAADPASNLKTLPLGLPDPVLNLRMLWRPVHKRSRSWEGLFDLPCFASYDQTARQRIMALLRKHRQVVRGWVRVVLAQGGDDPWEEVRARLHDVLLKTDLWSDQILVLRAVQTLTMLDVHHNCDLVWRLGGYSQSGARQTESPVDAAWARADANPGDCWTRGSERIASDP